MSLVEFFPPTGAGGGASTSANNTWSGGNTFDAEVDIDGALTFAAATMALNGATQTISGMSALLRVTGSTGSSTLALPASPIANQVIQIDSQASVSWTLSGNGKNVDGAASKTVAAPGPISLWYSGTAWESLTWAQYSLDSRFAQINSGNTFGGSNTFGTGGAIILNGRFQWGGQSFSGSGTILVNNGTWISFTGTSGGTITLPNPGSQIGFIFIVADEGGNAGANNITVSGNGNNIDGASSATIATNWGVLRVRWNGTIWKSF